jgi:hypothetical protein
LAEFIHGQPQAAVRLANAYTPVYVGGAQSPLSKRISPQGLVQSWKWLIIAAVELAVLLAVFYYYLTISWPTFTNCLSADGLTDVCYCEAFADGLVKEPMNTSSALAFSLVGLIIAVTLALNKPPSPVNRFTESMFFPAVYVFLAIFLGPGSMFFHGNLASLGGFMDTFSMYCWVGFLIAYNILRIFNIRNCQEVSTGVMWVVIVAVTATAQQLIGGGDVVFGTLVATAIISEIVVFIRFWGFNEWAHWQYFVFGLLNFGAAFVIWNLSRTGGPLCFPSYWLQGHAIWHTMCAVTVGLLYIYFFIQPDAPNLSAPSYPQHPQSKIWV